MGDGVFSLLMMVDENTSVRPPLTLPTLTDKGIVALAEIYPIVSAKMKKHPFGCFLLFIVDTIYNTIIIYFDFFLNTSFLSFIK